MESISVMKCNLSEMPSIGGGDEDTIESKPEYQHYDNGL